MNEDGSYSPVEVPGPAFFDNEFWHREVRRAAARFIAKGSKRQPQEPDEEHDVHRLTTSSVGSSSGAGGGGAGADGKRGGKRVRQQLESVRGALRHMKVQLKGTASDGSWKVGLRPLSWA